MDKFEANKLQVMTFNIKFADSKDPSPWSDRLQLIVILINRYQPHIIGFQEVTAEMYEDLKTIIGSHYDSYGVLRSENLQAEMSPIFFKKENFSVIKSSTIWLSESGEIGSVGWDAQNPRIASSILLKNNNITMPQMSIINTHLDHIGKNARLNSIDKITSLIKEFQQKGYPTILMGDMNCSPNELCGTAITNINGISDSYTLLSEYDKIHSQTSHAFKGGTIGDYIDYVITFEPLKIDSSTIIREKIDGKFPSDHYPVLVDIDLMSNGKNTQ